MSENYEQEIDLKQLIYCVLCGRRSIVVWVFIIGFVVGRGSKCLAPEYLLEEQLKFEREYA